jgi:hypothetical protein
MAPPQIQQIEQGDGEVPPAVQAQMTQMQQQMEQAQQFIQQLQQELENAKRGDALQIELQRMKESAAEEREELKGFIQILLKRMDQNQMFPAAAQEAQAAVQFADQSNSQPPVLPAPQAPPAMPPAM